jgi:hypothetical protein
VTDAHILETGLPAAACPYEGLDCLSAIDYLKSQLPPVPPKLTRDQLTTLLCRRRDKPLIVLMHQVASLFPKMPHLEREMQLLVQQGKVVQMQLQGDEVALMRHEDMRVPFADINALSEDEVRRYAAQGYLVRKDGRLQLSVPGLGIYTSSLRLARRWVLQHLKKGIALEKDLQIRYDAFKEGGLVAWHVLMHDLVGSSRMEVLRCAVGRALRITKRGRSDL